jgi:hypothetical protein
VTKEVWVKGKLAPCYIGPFPIVERCGSVAYKLDLPPSLAGVHNILHASQLKKCLKAPIDAVLPIVTPLEAPMDALAPLLHRPRCRQAGAGRAAASATVGRAPSPVSAEMGHQPKWLGQFWPICTVQPAIFPSD